MAVPARARVVSLLYLHILTGCSSCVLLAAYTRHDSASYAGDPCSHCQPPGASAGPWLTLVSPVSPVWLTCGSLVAHLWPTCGSPVSLVSPCLCWFTSHGRAVRIMTHPIPHAHFTQTVKRMFEVREAMKSVQYKKRGVALRTIERLVRPSVGDISVHARPACPPNEPLPLPMTACATTRRCPHATCTHGSLVFLSVAVGCV